MSDMEIVSAPVMVLFVSFFLWGFGASGWPNSAVLAGAWGWLAGKISTGLFWCSTEAAQH